MFGSDEFYRHALIDRVGPPPDVDSLLIPVPEVAEVCGASGAARLRAEARRFAPPLAPVVRRAARGFLETAGLI